MRMLLLFFCLLGFAAQAQDPLALIQEKEVARVLGVLAADDMGGRRTFTPSIDKAAAFIAEEFKQAGLQSTQANGSFLQSFQMVRPQFLGASAQLDGQVVDTKNIVVVTCQPQLVVTEQSGYALVRIAKGDNLFAEARKHAQLTRNLVVLVDTAFAGQFGRLVGLKNMLFSSAHSVVFLLTAQSPSTFKIEAQHQIQTQNLANVVGVLPGKTLPNEYVIFSGHYDHLGTNSRRAVNGDSIFNGANDDAAGTTAVMLLARYYKALGNNARTLVFAAFTAEEIGGYGATYFSQQFKPEQVKAMFNIEMIGTESKWGTHSAYITGYDKTDMGKIMQENLVGTGFQFYPDPYPDQNLFYRSDNATLARLGVPAHTISTSKMDNEPNYHKPSDEIGTLDLANMTRIIQAIALSARGIVAGKQTPTRVDTSSLR